MSTLYKFLLKKSYRPLTLDPLWRIDIPELDVEFDWDKVWSNVLLASRNPEHQQIHYQFIHRTYTTPRRLFLMKKSPHPNCTFCSPDALGTYYHMVWECPGVRDFWEMVARNLSTLLLMDIPLSPSTLLLNDLSHLNFHQVKAKIFLAGLTAAKKLIAQRWKKAQPLTFRQWVLTFIDIAQLEHSVAQMHGANAPNVDLWVRLAEDLRVSVLSGCDAELA